MILTTTGTTAVAAYRDLPMQHAQLAYAQPVFSTWEAGAVQAALALKDLPDDWDRRRSKKPTVMAINGALEYIGRVAGLEFYVVGAPFVAPMSNGGVQLEWDHGGRHVEIEVPPEGPARYLAAEGDEVQEGEFASFPPDLTSLFGWLAAAR